MFQLLVFDKLLFNKSLNATNLTFETILILLFSNIKQYTSVI